MIELTRVPGGGVVHKHLIVDVPDRFSLEHFLDRVLLLQTLISLLKKLTLIGFHGFWDMTTIFPDGS